MQAIRPSIACFGDHRKKLFEVQNLFAAHHIEHLIKIVMSHARTGSSQITRQIKCGAILFAQECGRHLFAQRHNHRAVIHRGDTLLKQLIHQFISGLGVIALPFVLIKMNAQIFVDMFKFVDAFLTELFPEQDRIGIATL
jgi:hypothetical protein